MINCVGNAHQLPRGTIEALQGMYEDARSSAAFGRALGLGTK
jgi:hypothetical protein